MVSPTRGFLLDFRLIPHKLEIKQETTRQRYYEWSGVLWSLS